MYQQLRKKKNLWYHLENFGDVGPRWRFAYNCFATRSSLGYFKWWFCLIMFFFVMIFLIYVRGEGGSSAVGKHYFARKGVLTRIVRFLIISFSFCFVFSSSYNFEWNSFYSSRLCFVQHILRDQIIVIWIERVVNMNVRGHCLDLRAFITSHSRMLC